MTRRSRQTLSEVVNAYVRRLIEREGNASEIARRLGIHRQGLHEAMKKNGRRGLRLEHLNTLAESEGITTAQLLVELLKLSRTPSSRRQAK